MKKIFVMVIIVTFATVANAQNWIGGEFEYYSSKNKKYDVKQTTFSIAPEIGHNLNEKIAIAISLRYNETKEDKNDQYEGYGINPYVRYNAIKWDNVTLFVDGGFVMGKGKNTQTEMELQMKYVEIMVNPGISYAICDKLGLVAHMGRISYGVYKYGKENEVKENIFNFNLRSNITFGVYFNL